MKYKIEYLPKAVEDIESIVNYIMNTLKSPQSANDFIELLDERILKLESYPKFYEIYWNTYAILDTKIWTCPKWRL